MLVCLLSILRKMDNKILDLEKQAGPLLLIYFFPLVPHSVPEVLGKKTVLPLGKGNSLRNMNFNS